jgi:hypothetical protein
MSPATGQSLHYCHEGIVQMCEAGRDDLAWWYSVAALLSIGRMPVSNRPAIGGASSQITGWCPSDCKSSVFGRVLQMLLECRPKLCSWVLIVPGHVRVQFKAREFGIVVAAYQARKGLVLVDKRTEQQ